MDHSSHTNRSTINSEIKQTWQRVFPIKSSSAWCQTPQCNSLILAGTESSDLTLTPGALGVLQHLRQPLNLLSRARGNPNSKAELCAQFLGSSKPRRGKLKHPKGGHWPGKGSLLPGDISGLLSHPHMLHGHRR